MSKKTSWLAGGTRGQIQKSYLFDTGRIFLIQFYLWMAYYYATAALGPPNNIHDKASFPKGYSAFDSVSSLRNSPLVLPPRFPPHWRPPNIEGELRFQLYARFD